jgi:hypothetical protein
MEEPTRRIPYDELAGLIDAVAGSQRDTAPIAVPIDIPIDVELEEEEPPYVLPAGSGIHLTDNTTRNPVMILLATLALVAFFGIGVAVALL